MAGTKPSDNDKLKLMEDEINSLHATLEARGINSRGTCDIFGRPFQLPVNAEHKATVFNSMTLLSAAQPHMRVFWAATFGFFCTFFSVFAPAALGPYVRLPKDQGGLGLTPQEVSDAGNVAVTGTILMRVVSGTMCDYFGARKTFVILLMLGMPGLVVLITAQGAVGYTLGRFLIGLSLATFVPCQVWCSQFFERRIVGQVNATAGGWGNVGGGVTLLVMPQIMEAFLSATGSMGEARSMDTSWRLCIIVPMVMHLLAAAFCWTGRDLPDGSYSELETSGAKQKRASTSQGGSWKDSMVLVGFSNTNALIMLLTYGLCFGVELTMNNKLVTFFSRYYALSPRRSSTLGAVFSLMNLFARSWGGILSDSVAVKYGLRGRVTAMWICQMAEGFMCIMLGIVTQNQQSPDAPEFRGLPRVPGVFSYNDGLDSVDYYLNTTVSDVAAWRATGATEVRGMVLRCGAAQLEAPHYVEVGGDLVRFPANGRIIVHDPDPNCICNGNSLGVTMILIVIFSIFVQMAEGLHFGIVPYISRPALGVVSGMVGAGGNMGAVISGQFIIGSGDKAPLDDGFIYLGIVILTVSLLMHCIHFPGEGGILLGPNFPYDPQWIKPKESAKGSDQLDFNNVTTTKSVTVDPEKVVVASSA